ncbi:hypothetical protein AC249_AIPGENE15024 [Exaiptasia diaphana]|nr:hypothetical protein AC249_AIPGENE15024 [Exaiptasia diaphana]
MKDYNYHHTLLNKMVSLHTLPIVCSCERRRLLYSQGCVCFLRPGALRCLHFQALEIFIHINALTVCVVAAHELASLGA